MAKDGKKKPLNPYDAGEIAGLSAEQLRQRALKIDPWRTNWIGRVDVIPPADDERTALIDRALVLHGFLNEGQLREIHEVGDLWLKHKHAHRMASLLAHRTAEAAIQAERQEKAAKKAQKQREARERKRKRAEEIARRKAEDIIFLGVGVSARLSQRTSQREALQARGLPLLETPADVARALAIPIPKLRWLCFHNEAAEKTHYRYFEIPKRSGGMRQLSSPMPMLREAQRWILENILEKLPTEEPAHGFCKQRSTVTNAVPHIKQDLVINIDLSDFFPSITFPRVRGFFEKLGYSPAVATIFALLCTEPPRRAVEYSGKRYLVAVGERALPQGACTSPAISNQVTRKLDRRLSGMCQKHGWRYTRYADDLTFSAPREKRGEMGMFLARVRHILTEEGFALNPKKGRVQRACRRQSVTGIVVNDRLSLPREEVRRLRAILHQAEKTGLEAQNRENLPNFEAWLRGKIAYLSMVDPEKGKKMRAQLDRILAAP